MPNLSNHGLGGGGKALGVPVYPFETTTGIIENSNGTLDAYYGNDMIATAPENIQGQASCQIGDEMYFIGTATNKGHCFKYNLRTKIWTRLSDSPYGGSDKEWAVPFMTDIYYGTGNLIVKYDTSSNTHTSQGTFRYFAGSRATTDGENIYISGGNYSDSFKKMFNRFNPTTKEMDTLSEIPIELYNHGCIYNEYGEIYLFMPYQYGISGGGTLYVTRVLRYTIKNDTFTVMSEINDFAYTGGMITISNGYIYLINSSYNEDMYNGVCIYDYKRTMTGTILSDSPTARYSGHVGVLDNVIYMIGGANGLLSGDAMIVIKGETSVASVCLLCKSSKVYTDGNVVGGTITDFKNKIIVSDAVTLEKVNGAVRIPTDGKYALVGSSYATIGG